MLEERRQSAIRGCKVYRKFATGHVGADALVRPVERSSTGSGRRVNSGASLRRADEDICPYVVRGYPTLPAAAFLADAGLSASILRILRRRSAGVKGFWMNDTPGTSMSERTNSPLYPVM